MWKSKRRKYLEALLEGIRDRQYDLIEKYDEQDTKINILQEKLEILSSENAVLMQSNQDNTIKLLNKINTTEQNLNYYGMIKSIIDKDKYVNLEILLLQLQNTDSKKILICGFFGADNLGDELMLQTLLSCLPKEKLSSVTVMLFDNEKYNYYHLPDVNFIHMPKNRFDCNLLAQNFDCLIWGGGALIDDSDYFKNNITLNNLVINLSKRFISFNKDVIALGLSSNTKLNNPDYIKELKFVCENSKMFSVRDTNSEKVLKDLGITGITLIEDLIFYNKIWGKNITPSTNRKVTTIGIIWICHEDTEELFKKVISWLRQKFGRDCIIKCIPFYNYVSVDVNYYSRMIEKIEDSEHIIILPYSNDLEKIVSEINDTDYMVNMRYHGMVISNLLNKKSINICYDTHRHYLNKIKYIAELFGVDDKLLLFSEMNENFYNVNIEVATPKTEINSLVKQFKTLENIIFY